MTTLDTLARNSANAVHTSVLDVQAPARGIAGAAQAAAMWRMAGYALAGAAAGIAVVFALLIAAPTLDEPADSVVSTTTAIAPTVPTTIVGLAVTPTTQPPTADEEPILIAVPPVDDEDEPVLEPDTEPPVLELFSPRDGDHMEKKVVTFSGGTEPGATVLASGKFPAHVDADGLWTVDLVLAPGPNGVVISATDAAGNETQIRVTVHLDVEQPVVEEPKVEEPKEPTTTTIAEWVFTANQQYGTCSEPVPYDIFSGKAKPGTVVKISSPHGNGIAEVNDDGTWSVRVEFPTAPYNDQFTVTAQDQTGSKKTFQFVSLFEG
ncbi:MAG: hypothetical protein M3112_00515 [Actinomycetia bacterium]|nr:hypothetical protein [Actinomycetes bacterium]